MRIHARTHTHTHTHTPQMHTYMPMHIYTNTVSRSTAPCEIFRPGKYCQQDNGTGETTGI